LLQDIHTTSSLINQPIYLFFSSYSFALLSTSIYASAVILHDHPVIYYSITLITKEIHVFFIGLSLGEDISNPCWSH